MPRAFDLGMFPVVAASLRRGRRRRAAINFGDAMANSALALLPAREAEPVRTACGCTSTKDPTGHQLRRTLTLP